MSHHPGISVQQAAFVVTVVFVLAWLAVCAWGALRRKPPMARRRNTALKPIRIPRAPDPVCERTQWREFANWKRS